MRNRGLKAILAAFCLLSLIPLTCLGQHLIGDTITVGTTYQAFQHNGTIGRMIAQDDSGYLHFVWTNRITPPPAYVRHVFYNAIDPAGVQLWPATGYWIDESERAGCVTLDVNHEGCAFPAFHQVTNDPLGDPHAAVAFDFAPHLGAFQAIEPEWLYEFGLPVEIIWPKIQLDRDDDIHLVCTEYTSTAGAPMRQFYAHGTFDSTGWFISFPSSPETWTLIDYTMTIAADVATSEVSDRLAIGWTYCREEGFPSGTDYGMYNNDIYILIDEDGVDPDFSQAFNLTNFIPPDTTWLPDTLRANMDTLRAFDDMCLFFDQDDWLHVAFTTIAYFELQNMTRVNASIIWHWSEQYPLEFRVVANAWDPQDTVCCGSWNVKAQRPSLAQDPATGYLYCMYQQFDTDTTALSHDGWPSGEVYISVSTDNGWTWSVGTNVTQTITPTGGYPGQCWSEEYPSLAKVIDGDCHIEYILNRGLSQEDYTIKYVKYHRVPTDSIPSTPLIEQLPFHVWTAVMEPEKSARPYAFVLHKPYPNPFNPTAVISFELQAASFVKLAVYDVSGRQVAKLVNDWCVAGLHKFMFDGSNLASGIYLYHLGANGHEASGKMVLVK